MANITPIIMPKWGLSMKEGRLTSWLVDVGAEITVGMPIMEVETDKIANEVEAPDAGLLRRKVASDGDLLPVKDLLGVMAGPEVSEAEIDAFVAAWVTPATDEEETSAAPSYLYAEVDGIRVRYVQRGQPSGTPVLFLHGFGGDLDNWLFNLDAVGERAPVLALDLPGHGQSAIRLPGASIAALARFAGHFMTAIGIERAHLVGHSMGGAIAAQVAHEVPARVASLTLIASAGFGAEINSAYIEGFVKAPSRRELKGVLELLFADPGLVSRQMVDDVLKYKRLDGVTALLTGLGDALFAGGRQAELPGLALGATPPALIIWGRDDQVVPSSHAAKAPPGATVEIFDGVGHMAQMERANEVNRLMLRHIAG